MSLGFATPALARHSTHSLGAAFGAAAAAASLLDLSTVQVRHALSYAAQQASGIPFWNRDSRHVEKAFDFGGMGARNGVFSALVVAEGFSAVDDPFAGAHNLFTAFGETADPSRLVDGLGERYEIEAAAIKKWCVGSPIQAVLDAISAILDTGALDAGSVGRIRRIDITMPDDRIHIVDDRAMPDVCVQHLAALALIDRGLTFESCHDAARMRDPAVLALRGRIRLIGSAALTVATPARQAIVEIETGDGGALRHHARAVRGTPDNPMTGLEVDAKARDLAAPIIGRVRADELIAACAGLDDLACVRSLRPMLQA